jgi:hypothetical protein
MRYAIGAETEASVLLGLIVSACCWTDRRGRMTVHGHLGDIQAARLSVRFRSDCVAKLTDGVPWASLGEGQGVVFACRVSGDRRQTLLFEAR